MKKAITLISLLIISCFSYAQNMVQDPGFEQLVNCPVSYSDLDPTHLINWTTPTGGTSDYFNACSGNVVGVPTNFSGHQNAYEGVAYAGFYTYANCFGCDYREYAQGVLTPLVIGSIYQVTIRVSRGEQYKYATDGIGVYFRTSPIIPAQPYYTTMPVTPQVDYSNYGVIADTNWVTLTSTFLADSAYNTLIIGGFKSDAQEHYDTLNNNFGTNCYYYLDYVEVIQASLHASTTQTNVTCFNGSDGSISLTAHNGTAPYTYLWTPGGQTTPTISGLSAGTYICRVTDSTNTSIYDTVVITQPAPPLPPSIQIAASSDTICAAGSITFTATIANGGNTPVYQWRLNGIAAGANSNTYTPATLNNGDVITCRLTSNEACLVIDTVLSNPITVYTPHRIPMVGITAAPGTSICPGVSVTFTANTANGGNTPSYQWKKNGMNVGTNSNTYTDNTLMSNDVITCILTSNATCIATTIATSNTLTITLNASATPAVSIVAYPGTYIAQGTTVTFEASIDNGGLNPQYQWRKNGLNVAVGNPYITNNLHNYDVITCRLLSNRACAYPDTALSNPLVIHINLGVNNLGGANDLSLYPNPNNGTFTLSGALDAREADIEVLNILGQVVYNEPAQVQNGQVNKVITLPANCADGVYMLRIRTEQSNNVIRFTKNK